MKTFSAIAGALLIPMAVLGQVQNNGVAPIAPQPADMPAPGIFTVTAVTYAALPPNDHYSARLTSTGGGKSFGFLELGTANLEITYDSSNRQITFGNQFVAGAYGLDVLATDGPNYAGLYVDPVKGTRCFNQGPAGFAFDSQPGSYVSACTGVDNGVVVGTAYSTIVTRTILTGGESFSTVTGYNQTAFVGSTALGNFGFASGCCSRARGIRGDQIVGDTSCCSGVPLPSDALSLDSSPAANQNSQAALWLVSNPAHQVTLGGTPSMAVATNGAQQGGWAGSHAVMWSGASASMIDLNPAGYFDSRVTGMTPEFQAGDGWLGGPANSPGAKRHALLWKGSAASVIDLNQFLPASILSATINGADTDGNIIGSMITSTGQELGILFTPTPSISVASITLTPSNPAPGDTVTGTVTLGAPAAPGGVLVSFTSGNNTLAPAPATVLIPEGQTAVSFNVPTSATFFMAAPTAVTLTAHASLTARSATLTVTPATPVDPISSLTLSTASVNTGDTAVLQVSLSAPAPAGGVLVNFSSSNPAVVPAPASLIVPGGQSSASTSTITNSATLFQPVAVVLRAATGTVIQQATLTVASISKPNSVSLGNPQNVLFSAQGGTSGSGFVALSAVTTAPATVNLTSTNPALTVPASISVPAGTFFPTFTYTTLPVAALTSGTLTATMNGLSVSSTISVNASPSPSIQSLLIPLVSKTQTWSSGQTLTGTVTLTGRAFLGGMTVSLASDTPATAQVPASVVIPSGATSATFPVVAGQVTDPTPVTITATLPGFPAATVTLTVIPGAALTMTSYTLSPFSMIGPGVVTNGAITLNQPAPTGGIVIGLSANNLQPAKFPATVTVPQGQTSVTFAIQGNGVSSATTVSLTASYSGILAPLGASAPPASLTVAPTDTLKAPKPTWSTSTNVLTVSATSTNPQAIIAVLNASGNVPLGTMTNLGNGNYTFQTTIASIASVNLKSNLGGATGQGVTVIP